MILKFATKRNAYGHRNGLEIDTDNKTYKLNYSYWHSDEYTEIKATDRKKLIEQLENEGYTRID